MTGEHAESFELTDQFRRFCAIDGYPTVSLADRGGRLGLIYADGAGTYVIGLSGAIAGTRSGNENSTPCSPLLAHVSPPSVMPSRAGPAIR